MKASIITSIILGSSVVCASAFADAGKSDAKHAERQQQHFAELDTNKDGRLSREEFQAKRGQLWTAADADNDGAVTLAEAQQASEKMVAEFAQKRFAKLDTDRDGKVTKAEAAHMPEQRFTRLDTNNDGALTQAELAVGPKHGPGRSKGGKPPVEHFFKRLDTNADGKLTKAEVDAVPSPFDGMDKDGDGYVSTSEFKPGFGKHMRHGGHGSHRGPRQERGE
jgi:Ca2+-binding EF-hand superfamily protein